MSKRADLEEYLYTIYTINPEVGQFVAADWADNLLVLLGLEIQITEKLVLKG